MFKTKKSHQIYWPIVSSLIIAFIIMVSCKTCSTSYETVILAKEGEQVYVVTPRNCGKCVSDIWTFIDDNGHSILKSAPLLQSTIEYRFIKVGHNLFSHKTMKHKNYSSYQELWNACLDENAFVYDKEHSDYLCPVYKDIQHPFNGKPAFLFFILIPILAITFLIPFKGIVPSNEQLLELSKWLSKYRHTCSEMFPKYTLYKGFYKIEFYFASSNCVQINVYNSHNYSNEYFVYKVMLTWDDKKGWLENAKYSEKVYINSLLKDCIEDLKYTVVNTMADELLNK